MTGFTRSDLALVVKNGRMARRPERRIRPKGGPKVARQLEKKIADLNTWLAIAKYGAVTKLQFEADTDDGR